MEKETTTNEIMGFLQEHMVTKEEFLGLKGEVGDLHVKVNQTKLDLIDAMDDKLGDLRADIVVLMRKEDRKVTSLIELMREKELLTKEEAGSLLELEPFPRCIQHEMQ